MALFKWGLVVYLTGLITVSVSMLFVGLGWVNSLGIGVLWPVILLMRVYEELGGFDL